jgi:hypothetical protein
VRHLYRVGSATAASLILLFSVVVPFTKALLVLWAVLHKDQVRRRRTLNFVEVIAKWSMADVFAVALFIAYLAARASQTPPGAGFVPQVVTFTATFGPGFYWFAGYCLVSLGVQQATARLMRASSPLVACPPSRSSPSRFFASTRSVKSTRSCSSSTSSRSAAACSRISSMPSSIRRSASRSAAGSPRARRVTMALTIEPTVLNTATAMISSNSPMSASG